MSTRISKRCQWLVEFLGQVLNATMCIFLTEVCITFLLAFILCIQITLEDFQKVPTDEQESHKSLDASVKVLTVSLCMVTDCNLHQTAQ